MICRRLRLTVISLRLLSTLIVFLSLNVGLRVGVSMSSLGRLVMLLLCMRV